jgi:hypothetical protein
MPVLIRGENHGMEGRSVQQKLEYSMQLHEELHKYYMAICKLFVLAEKGGYRMIIENPSTQPHYLTQFFPIKPTLIDKDRRINGDYYRKPTQYWFVNCTPEQNMFFEPIEDRETGNIENYHEMKTFRHVSSDRNIKRSLMHPQYARRFIRQFIYNGEEETSEGDVK